MHDYVPVFRSVLAHAAHSAWRHRGLWLFGFLAGLAQTGAVTNDVLRMAPKLEPGALSWSTLEDAWNGLAFGKAFVAGLITGTPGQIALTVISSIVIAFFGVFIICGSQHLVLQGVHRAAKGKDHPGLAGLLRELRHVHVWRIFAVDVLLWLATSILLLGGGIVLRQIIAAVPDARIYAAFGAYLVLLPLVFTLSSIGILTLVKIIRYNDSITGAFHKATTFFSRHWLFTLEFAAILFVVNFFVTAVLAVCFVLFAQVLVSIFSAGITSLLTIVGLFAFSAILLVLFIVFVGGMTTIFNYSAWTEFVARMSKKTAHPRLEHAAARVRRSVRRR